MWVNDELILLPFLFFVTKNNYETSLMKRTLNQYFFHQPFPLVMLRPMEAKLYPKHFKGLSLDVGCGDGFFAEAVFGKRAFDVGIDVDGDILEKARVSGAYRRVLKFDGINMPFENGEFKTVLANCVLEHVDDPEELIREIGRITTKEGRFYFTVPTVYFEEMLLGVKVFNFIKMNWLMKWYGKFMSRVTRQKYYWPLEKWVKVLNTAGFEVEKHQEFFGRRAMVCFDLAHWLSLPSILTKLLLKRWVLFENLEVKVRLLNRLRRWCVEGEGRRGGIQFFVVRKTEV